jgi:hypothetical protein
MDLRDLFDDAVGAEEPKLAADAGAEAADLRGRGTAGTWVEQLAQVAVAETGRGEFAAGDGLKQGQVIGVAESEGFLTSGLWPLTSDLWLAGAFEAGAGGTGAGTSGGLLSRRKTRDICLSLWSPPP